MLSLHLRLMTLLMVVLVGSSIAATIDSHRSGCHRWHSCASDHGTYVCGDLGYYSQCSANEYCLGGKPRPTAGQQVLPPPSLPHGEVLTAPVLKIVDGDTIDVRLEGAPFGCGILT